MPEPPTPDNDGPPAGNQPDPPPVGRNQFPQTRWSMVLTAKHGNPRDAAVAMEHLCTTYWFPLYAFVRRRGYSPQDAEDLTQAFFARLIEKNSLHAADKERGKLRSFLLTSLKHFLADEWDKATAKKRGGGKTIISIDQVDAENRFRLEPADERSPDVEFERRWALALLDSVVARLHDEFEAAGKGKQFEVLQTYLTTGTSAARYGEAAGSLGMTENNVRVTVFRLRRKYGDLLRQHIAETVASESEVEEELQHLLSTLRTP